MNNLISDLIGKRVEAITRDDWSHSGQSRSEPITGLVRAIASANTDFCIMIEDDNHVIHTRVLTITTLKVLPDLLDPQQTLATLMKEMREPKLRNLDVGDCFRWKTSPPGYTSNKVLIVDKAPGWAMPEGWDFFLVSVLDSEVEILDEKPVMPDSPALPAEE